jgi:hypothetical protein
MRQLEINRLSLAVILFGFRHGNDDRSNIIKAEAINHHLAMQKTAELPFPKICKTGCTFDGLLEDTDSKQTNKIFGLHCAWIHPPAL